jgi:hypothetical protein
VIDLTSGKSLRRVKAKSNVSEELRSTKDLSISVSQNTKDSVNQNESGSSPKGTFEFSVTLVWLFAIYLTWFFRRFQNLKSDEETAPTPK